MSIYEYIYVYIYVWKKVNITEYCMKRLLDSRQGYISKSKRLSLKNTVLQDYLFSYIIYELDFWPQKQLNFTQFIRKELKIILTNNSFELMTRKSRL